MLPPNLYARVRFCHVHWHARPRVRQAPGLPCALLFKWRATKLQTSGGMRREIAEVWIMMVTATPRMSRRLPLPLRRIEPRQHVTSPASSLVEQEKARLKAGLFVHWRLS